MEILTAVRLSSHLKISILFLFSLCVIISPMSQEDRMKMRDKVKEMFMHGYLSYKNHAYPADELMPLSCSGRYRHRDSSRGDVDDALGNFSLTMIDTLDSLFLFNEFDEFEYAVKSLVEGVSFDADVDVSVFETNIRVLGGLLGGHVAALLIRKTNHSRMQWYRDDLLHMAVDIGDRLLPAFNTSTGIPFPRVNLKHGSRGVKKQEENTCTACAGTMILEFAALSRFTGNPIYEEKAVHALGYLWKQRSRHSDLVGRVINVQSGDWIRRESGIGAGIDSYYEYLLKAYVLLGEPVYLHRFHTHYSAVKRYVSGPQSAAFPFLFLDVNMHQPSERVRSFMDALFAFWPGLQVLTGDVKPAIALHEYLFQVHKRNKLLPEAFTPDLKVYWGEHLLRPEFIESTYLLYQATGDPYYLDVGVQVVNDLERYARVPCGYAAIQDVRTMKHIDRFDSFVLAETFKYLYLLFSDPSELPLPLNEYVLTTEAHFLPLSLSQLRRPIDAKPSLARETSTHTDASSEVPPVCAQCSDKHGDRDHVAEADLSRRGRCPAVYLEHLDTSLSDCSATMTAERQNATAQLNSRRHCQVFEGPGLHRTRLVLLQWFRGQPNRTYCPKPSNRQQLWRHIDLIRQPLRQLAFREKESSENAIAGDANTIHVPLRAVDFRPDDQAQLALLRRMGIEFVIKNDGRLVIKHDQSAAESQALGVAGLLFVHELVSLTRARQEAEETPFYENANLTVLPRHVVILDPPAFGRVRFRSLPAHFDRFPGENETTGQDNQTVNGSSSTADRTSEAVQPDPDQSWRPVVAPLRVAYPIDGCTEISAEGMAYPPGPSGWNVGADSAGPSTDGIMGDPELLASRGPMAGSIGVVRRGGCLFVQKARNLVKAGAVGGIVLDYEPDTSVAKTPLFTMSGEEDPSKNDVDVPFTLLFAAERDQLIAHMRQRWIQSRRPTMVMLTKDFDAPHAFLTSQSLFRTEQLNEQQSSAPTWDLGVRTRMFELYSKLVPAEPRAGKSPHRLETKSGGGVGIVQLPGVPMACSSHADRSLYHACLSDLVQVTGTQWLITLFVDQEQLSEYYSNTHADHGYPTDVVKWMLTLEHALSRETLSNSCRGLLLALFEASLHSMQPRTDQKHMAPMSLSFSWVSEINRCLNRLKDMAVFESTFGLQRGSERLPPGIDWAHVSLSLSFHPILDAGLKSSKS